MQTTVKKAIKVTFKGDMKRLKMTSDYASLVEQTQKAFGAGVIPAGCKYFYMDEDNEMISINSQYDLEEALSNEDLTVLKLIASTSVQEAREQLCQEISDNMSMRESLNQSGFFEAPVTQGMARLSLASQPSNSGFETQRAPIMRSAFQDEFESLNHSSKMGESMQTKEEPELICTKGPEPIEQKEAPADKTQELPRKRDQKYADKAAESSSDDDCKDNGEPTQEEAQHVRDDVRDFCRQAFSGMLINFLKDKRAKQAEVEHKGYICDVCEVNPIKGIRYKCSVRNDYDLCESCEAKGTHNTYPMLKIRDPSMAPANLICQYNSIPNIPASAQPEPIKVPVEQPKPQKAPESKKKNWIKYSGRFVKESFGDKYIVSPGQVIRKTWTFRNDGETSWPEDTLFIQTNGDNMKTAPVAIDAEVKKDSEYTWEVELTAPEKEGRYQCYFRMVTGNNYRFGHKVWADIFVQAPQVVEAPVKEEAVVEEPEQMECDFIQESKAEADKPVDYPVIENEEEPADKAGESALDISIRSSGLTTPKELYNNKIDAAELNEAQKQNLRDLFELGFVNFEVNKALLEKFKNDIQKVCNVLCEGALSESCIAAVYKEN